MSSPKQSHRRGSQSMSMSELALNAHPSQANPYGNFSPSSPPNVVHGFQTGSPAGKQGKGYVFREAKHLSAFIPTEAGLSEERQGVKALLLENVNESGIKLLKDQNYIVETEKGSLGEDELIQRMNKGEYQILGIRSKTKVTKKIIDSCPSLLVIGCFCIGTNQVDLPAAAHNGIAVFNSPFSNSRSVAELVISEVIALSRQLADRTNEMRRGEWNKVSKGCWEIRNKTLGIIGYGHIGSQLSVLAEAMGMHVLYYDVLPLMPLGSANQTETLEELLQESDFVTLHVPEIPETINMIGAEQIAHMKKGSYLLNNARGTVVDLQAVANALKSGKLAGAAIDVYPKEPAKNGQFFDQSLNSFAPDLCSAPNVILTPHIGGSTEEAQRAIGSEVGSALVRYINFGASLGAVNFPEVNLKPIIGDNVIRLCHIHLNQPGVLKGVNNVLGEYNVERQLSDSKGGVAYLMADIADVKQEDIKQIYSSIMSTSANVATRILY